MLCKERSMTMILENDLYQYISEYDDRLYQCVKEDKTDDINSLKEELFQKLEDLYELKDKTDHFSESKIVYVKDFINQIFDEHILDFTNRIEQRKDIHQKVEKLKKLKLPEQRSQEWYDLRNKVMTASSLADAIGEGHFSTREELLIQKCGGPRGEVPFHIVEWGVMYEPVATRFYELMNNVTVLEFGLVPHPEFKIFGASPDGICDTTSPADYIGRMLEIKCPPKRQFTKEVPRHYWMQMQGQLEACDLEECDFLQVKIIEYFSEQDYQDDIFKENDSVQEGYSSLQLPKGLLLAFVTRATEGDPEIKYEYCEFYQSYDELIQWSKNIIQEYRDKNIQYDECIKHWWKIERYECSLVGRDRKWWLGVQPKLIDFWEDVEHYRKVGIQEFLDKKEEKKTKKIKLKKEKPEIKKTVYEIDKSIVEDIQQNYYLNSD